LNENLVKNKDVWSTKITEMKERYYLSSKSRHGKLCIFASLWDHAPFLIDLWFREKKAVRAKDEKIQGLEEQVKKHL